MAFTLFTKPLFIVSALVLAGISLGTFASNSLAPQNTSALGDMATCFEMKDSRAVPNVPCLKPVVKNLLEQYSPRQLFSYVTATSTPKILTGASACHVVGHLVGEVVYEEAGSVERAFSACDTRCAYACYHGAIITAVAHETGSKELGERFAHDTDREVLEAVGKKYCTNGVVCHGIGHLLYNAFTEPKEALEMCDRISGDTQNPFARHAGEACYEGVFMEAVDSVAAAQLELQRLPARPDISCTEVAPQYRLACFRYEPHILRTVGTGTKDTQASGLAGICSRYSGQDRANCFEGSGFLYGLALYRSPVTTSICASFGSENDRSACMVGVILGFSVTRQFDQSISYCSDLSGSPGQKNLCYQATFQGIEYMANRGPGAILNMCERSPAVQECKNQFSRYNMEKQQLPFFYMDPLKLPIHQ